VPKTASKSALKSAAKSAASSSARNKTLTDYNRKRDFDRTPEPQGSQHKPPQAAGFVVQKHRRGGCIMICASNSTAFSRAGRSRAVRA